MHAEQSLLCQQQAGVVQARECMHYWRMLTTHLMRAHGNLAGCMRIMLTQATASCDQSFSVKAEHAYIVSAKSPAR